MLKHRYEELLLARLHNLRTKDGLYIASSGKLYRHCWIRDIYYQALPELGVNNSNYTQTYHSVLDYLRNMETKYRKLSWLIDQPFPLDAVRILHPRFSVDKEEITSDWGNIQFDAFGYFLFGVAQGLEKDLPIIRDEIDRDMLCKIVKILESVEYWHTVDNGIWEENLEVHASSIGAIVAGLERISPYIVVDDSLIEKGYAALKDLLPRESITKECDTALLTLIWPFNIVGKDMRNTIIRNVENSLKRDMGFIRYKGDRYYNIGWFDHEFEGNEAEWTLGPLFLSIINCIYGNIEKAEEYFDSVLQHCPTGKIPELYYSKTKRCNINVDLGWPTSLAVIANRYILRKRSFAQKCKSVVSRIFYSIFGE